MHDNSKQNNSAVNVALIGIGGYGHFYVEALNEMHAAGQAKITAVIDPLAEKSPNWPALANEGIPLYETIEEFLKKGKRAELAVISSPIAFHADQTCAALEAGMNVLCEKPITAHISDAHRMLAARDASGKFLEIGYQWSFSKAIQDLKTDIMAGRLGRPQLFRTWVAWPRPASYFERNSWAGKIHDDSGAAVFDSPANNATAHYLHNMLYLLGPETHLAAIPKAITAECYRANPIENFDAVGCRIETRENVDVFYYTAHCVQNMFGPLSRFELENATVEIGEDKEVVARFKDGHEQSYGNPNQDNRRKLKHCLDRCRSLNGGRTICGPEAAMAQTLCINGLQQMPVYDLKPPVIEQTQAKNGSTLTYVPGLEEAMRQACEQGKLFSEMNLPWAGPSHRVELENLSHT